MRPLPALAVVALLTACSSTPSEPTPTPAPTSSTAAGRATAGPTDPGTLSGVPSGPAGPSPVTEPGPTLVPGPPAVRTIPTAPPEPGSLATLDWSTRAPADACPAARVGQPSFGDLDADRRDEAAVPVGCGDGTGEVLVYAGDAGAPRLLGKALVTTDGARLHGVQFREPHLVVTSLTWRSGDRTGEPDTAVTTRWVLSAGALVRTDRWEDPAFVLETDEE